LTYLISDSVPESDLNKVTGKIGGFVSDLKGKVLKEEIWGRRKLAYPIKKQEFATYVTINLELPATVANELEREIRLTGEILRHLMIVRDYGHEELTLSAKEIAETEAIEEVAGGEKSFEAIEGETDESKDLMAVRENQDEEEKEESQVKEQVENQAEEKEEAKEEAPKTEAKDDAAPAEEKTEEKKAPRKAAKKKDEDKSKDKEPVEEKKKAKKEDEADRLSKLNEELDDILKDEL
jgi:small subunit ribosomal protein S6